MNLNTPLNAELALRRRISNFVAKTAGNRSSEGGEEICVGTNLGSVRKENQDRALIAFPYYAETSNKNFFIGVLSDGIGGLSRGEEAAILTVSAFTAHFICMDKLSLADRLKSSAEAANSAVFDLLKGKGGATISAVAINILGNGYGINAGDSRIYGISKRRAKQLSIDDTLANYLTRSGQDSFDERSNSLVQFIGMGDGLEPHLITISSNDFDSVLLTSDGAHSSHTSALSEIIQASNTNFELIQRLLTFSQILGGRDNATVLALPLKFDFQPDDTNDGLVELKLLSPFDTAELWSPINNFSRPIDSNLIPERTDDLNRTPKKKSPNNKAKKKTVKKSERDDRLPLEDERPPLTISFPKTSKQP